MSIQVPNVPENLLVPGQYINTNGSRAVQGLQPLPLRLVMIGHRLPTGAVLAHVPVRISRPSDASVAFGSASMLAGMFRALKVANPYVECWGIAVDDLGIGVANTWSVAFSGSVQQADVLSLYCGGMRAQVGVLTTDTLAQIATKTAAAINAVANYPVTAAVDGTILTQVNLTARHKGTLYNALDVRLNYQEGEARPLGLGVAIVSQTIGSGNPDIGLALAAMAGEHYTHIVSAYGSGTNLTLLENELVTRFSPLVQKEAFGFASVRGSLATMATLGEALNSPHTSIFGAGLSPSPPWITAAIVAGVDASEADPAIPRQSLLLPGFLPPAPQQRLEFAERQQLLVAGISTFRVDQGGKTVLERLVTTYKSNLADGPDISFRNRETLGTTAAMRFTLRSRIAQRYPQHKLTSDEGARRFAAGQRIVSPGILKTEMIALAKLWVEVGWMENLEQFKRDLMAERNLFDPDRVDALLVPDLVNQFRVFAADLQFILDGSGSV